MPRPEYAREWDRTHKTRTGNKPPGRYGGVKPRERELMQKMRDEGHLVEQIAERFNRHYVTVVKHTHART